MAGAYCRYCNNRCFVYRVLPDRSWSGHMATCAEGMAFDRAQTGYDHTTAINPNPLAHDDRDGHGCLTAAAAGFPTLTDEPGKRHTCTCGREWASTEVVGFVVWQPALAA